MIPASTIRSIIKQALVQSLPPRNCRFGEDRAYDFIIREVDQLFPEGRYNEGDLPVSMDRLRDRVSAVLGDVTDSAIGKAKRELLNMFAQQPSLSTASGRLAQLSGFVRRATGVVIKPNAVPADIASE